MRLQGLEVREIASLSTAPGFQGRHDNEATRKVMKKLLHGDDVATPVITPEGRLAWGERVIAALVGNQTSHCMCKVVACTEEELALLRHVDTGKKIGTQLMELIRLTEAEVLQEWARDGTPIFPSGRAKSEHARARECVADILEYTIAALETFESRVRRVPAKPEPAAAWSLQCHDWEPAPGLLEEARKVRQTLRNIDQRLRQDQRELTPLPEAVLPGAGRLREALHKLASHVRLSVPEHLCPYCKSVVAVRPNCAGCKCAGWVSEDVWLRAPEELRKDYLVSHGGQVLDPLTMQPPRRPAQREKYQSAQFVGNTYEEEEEPPDEDDGWWKSQLG